METILILFSLLGVATMFYGISRLSMKLFVLGVVMFVVFVTATNCLTLSVK